jgi:hypothetical protein
VDSDLWPTVAAAITAAQAGVATAALILQECWDAASSTDDHALQCVIAHDLADLQSDVADELLWDRRALEAHDRAAGSGFRAFGLDSGEQLLPSLHLNLGDDWLRMGDHGRAEHHLRQARAATHVLGNDGYGHMITRGLAHLADRLAQASAGE